MTITRKAEHQEYKLALDNLMDVLSHTLGCLEYSINPESAIQQIKEVYSHTLHVVYRGEKE